mgnify:CR=1 FL=1
MAEGGVTAEGGGGAREDRCVLHVCVAERVAVGDKRTAHQVDVCRRRVGRRRRRAVGRRRHTRRRRCPC